MHILRILRNGSQPVGYLTQGLTPGSMPYTMGNTLSNALIKDACHTCNYYNITVHFPFPGSELLCLAMHVLEYTGLVHTRQTLHSHHQPSQTNK